MKKAKGIVLYSGGLDSLLAAKVLMNQGIDVIGYHCILPFTAPGLDPMLMKSSQFAKDIGLKLKFYYCDREYLEMVKNPKHGHGKNYNPCIDCKIHFIKKAAQYMCEIGADFIATGEVMGQRPMSQLKHMLKHIEKETAIAGRLLRPLCAKNLEPTIPELEGLIDREKLYDISGRSRKKQIELANEFGINEYASPAGGCLFTDPQIAKRVKDLLEHHSDYTRLDVYLLTIGRHFRISDKAKIIVARNESEYITLEQYQEQAQYVLIPNFKGPYVIGRGDFTDSELHTVAAIINRYGKPGAVDIPVVGVINEYKKYDIKSSEIIEDEQLNAMRI